MKVAIMQPYFMPYIGYWQLINVVDVFVILDDVNFIRRGFINRNSILINGQAHMFSIPIQDASQNRLIMNTKLCFDNQHRYKFNRLISTTYKKALQFEKVMPLIEEIIDNKTNDLTEFIQFSLIIIKKYLNMKTKILKSSELRKDNSLHAQDKIIEICRCLNADIYINASGGRKLYQTDIFKKQNIDLLFLDPKYENIKYIQFKDQFVENLSIIDVLMFNEKKNVLKLLGEYELNNE